MALDGVPDAFAARLAQEFRDASKGRHLGRTTVRTIKAHCGSMIRTAFRLELSLPSTEPCAVDGTLRERGAAMRRHHADLLRWCDDARLLAAYGEQALLSCAMADSGPSQSITQSAADGARDRPGTKITAVPATGAPAFAPVHSKRSTTRSRTELSITRRLCRRQLRYPQQRPR